MVNDRSGGPEDTGIERRIVRTVVTFGCTEKACSNSQG